MSAAPTTGTIMRRTYRAAVAAIATICLGVLAACGGTANTSGAGGLTPLTLQQYPGALLYISDIVAKDQGIFTRNGLDVSFVNPGDGATSMRLIANGDTLGVLGDVAAGITAAGKGQPIGVVGSVINKSLFQISARSDLLATPGDWKAKLAALRGKKVGVPGIGGSADVVMRGMLRAAGLEPDKDVTVVSVTTIAAATAQFQQKALDAFIYIAPAAELLQKAGVGGLYVDIAKEAPPQFADSIIGMIVNAPEAQRSADTVARWKRSEEQAIAFMRDPANRSTVTDLIAANITAKDTALAGRLLDYMVGTAYSATDPGLAVPQQALQGQIDLLSQAGTVPTGSVTPTTFVVGSGAAGN